MPSPSRNPESQKENGRSSKTAKALKDNLGRYSSSIFLRSRIWDIQSREYALITPAFPP